MTENSGYRRKSLLAALERIVARLADPDRANVTAGALIVAYVLLWWGYAVVAKGSQDIHFDMGEVALWGLVPSYGYPKHPPFPGWVAAIWFGVFPRADWSFYLLSTASIGVALWFVWLIAKRFIPGDKRVLAFAMLTLSPGFNFQPLKFNSNALLIPVWAAACYAFLRSFEQRNVVWGVLAGIAVAIAMLTKYWSIFLIVGIVAAVLSDRQCWSYLKSPAPWAAVVVGALLFGPNVVTLFHYDFEPFKYATSSHTVPSFGDLIRSLGNYLGGLLLLSGGFLAVAIACQPNADAIHDMLLPRERDRRIMAIATWTAFLAPMLLALLLSTRLDSNWTLPMWAMLPATLLASPKVEVTRKAAAQVLGVACALPLIALLLSPAIAYVIHGRGLPNHASHYRLIAQAVDKAWRETTDRPLRFIGGNLNIALSAAFYLPSRPLVLDIAQPNLTPWADETSVARDGIALVCPADDAICHQQIELRAGGADARRTEVALSRTYLGVADPPMRYVILTVPPRR